MSYSKNEESTSAQNTSAPGDNCTVLVPFPREVVERALMFEFTALRDERFLKLLSEEDRLRLGDNPVGEIALLSTDQLVAKGSLTHGVGCKGTPAFSHGVTCKWLKIPAPP